MIRHAILAVIANAMVLWGVTEMLPQYLIIEGGLAAFLVPGLILGLFNAILKPVLKLLALPFIVLTAGLFSILINVFVLFAVEYTVNIFRIGEMVFKVEGGFLSYAITAFVLALMNEFARWLIKS